MLCTIGLRFFIFILVFITVLQFLFIISMNLTAIDEVILPELSARTYRRAIVGIRPFRKTGIRLQTQQLGQKCIIHNYGHGGAGISLSPATAIEASQLAEKNLRGDRVAVLGCGIVGLLTALQLSKKGYKVVIYANRIPQPNQKNVESMCTSEVAPGYWNPYHYKFTDWDIHNKRSAQSYEQFKKWHTLSPSIQQVYSYEQKTIKELQDSLPPYILQHLKETQVRVGQNIFKQYKFPTYQIHLQNFLQELTKICKEKGVVFVQKNFQSLSDVLKIDEKTIVNCMALANKYIFGDKDVYGVKGTLLQFQNTTKTVGIISFIINDSLLQLYMFRDKVLVGLTTEQSQDIKVDKAVQSRQLSKAIKFYKECYPSPKL